MKKYIVYSVITILVVLGVLVVKYNYQDFLGRRTISPIYSETYLQTEISRGSFADATTTFVSVANPFTSTSTVDLFILDQTGVATSTSVFDCGTSTNPNGAATKDYIVDNFSVATSTKVYLVGGQTGVSTSSVFAVGKNEYVTCFVAANVAASITQATNTFDGKYLIRWNLLR